jgi:hypothetical protein
MSFLFLVGLCLVLIFVTFLVYLGEFEWFGCDDFKLGSAFIADHNVPFFNFVGVEIENALAFLTNWHTTLLSRSIRMMMTAREDCGLASFWENNPHVKELAPGTSNRIANGDVE